MNRLKAGAAAVAIPTQPDASALLPPGQEAELRAAALVLEAGERVCFVSCDSMIVPADVLAQVVDQVVAGGLVPFPNLLICATHTHHAPCTIEILGCTRDEGFCTRLQAAIIAAITEACRALDDSAGASAELVFAQSQEATVGSNSRYLLKDGTIAWYAYPWEAVVRPTGRRCFGVLRDWRLAALIAGLGVVS